MSGRARSWFFVLAAACVGLGALATMPARANGEGVQALPFGEVNWKQGVIRVSAMGLPSFGGYAGDGREMARQNAVSLAKKRLLGVLLDLPSHRGKLRDQLAARPELKDRLRELVASAGVAGKDYSDGSVEITLTLPMDGAGGVRALLREP